MFAVLVANTAGRAEVIVGEDETKNGDPFPSVSLSLSLSPKDLSARRTLGAITSRGTVEGPNRTSDHQKNTSEVDQSNFTRPNLVGRMPNARSAEHTPFDSSPRPAEDTPYSCRTGQRRRCGSERVQKEQAMGDERF